MDDKELKHSMCEELRCFSKEFNAIGMQHLRQSVLIIDRDFVEI